MHEQKQKKAQTTHKELKSTYTQSRCKQTQVIRTQNKKEKQSSNTHKTKTGGTKARLNQGKTFQIK